MVVDLATSRPATRIAHATRSPPGRPRSQRDRADQRRRHGVVPRRPALCGRPGVAAVMPRRPSAGDIAAVRGAGAGGAAARRERRRIACAAGHCRRSRCAAARLRLARHQIDPGMRDALEDELLFFRSHGACLAARRPATSGRRRAPRSTTRTDCEDVLRARRLGFRAVHPSSPGRRRQPALHAQRSRAGMGAARADAAAASGGAAVAVDGKMVDSR